MCQIKCFQARNADKKHLDRHDEFGKFFKKIDIRGMFPMNFASPA